jgi:hypothetical protein
LAEHSPWPSSQRWRARTGVAREFHALQRPLHLEPLSQRNDSERNGYVLFLAWQSVDKGTVDLKCSDRKRFNCDRTSNRFRSSMAVDAERLETAQDLYRLLGVLGDGVSVSSSSSSAGRSELFQYLRTVSTRPGCENWR